MLQISENSDLSSCFENTEFKFVFLLLFFLFLFIFKQFFTENNKTGF